MARPFGTKNIESPEQLWSFFEAYVKSEANNPMFKTEYVGKDGREVKTALNVPITFDGFECYLEDQGIINDLGHYSQNHEGRYTDFVPIVSRIKRNCFVQNFKGASVGLFNAGIIAKKLGLVEKTQNENTNRNFDITIDLGDKKPEE